MLGKLTVVKGDVRSPQMTNENEVAIIPHCCNNLGVMGAGVALALRNKWPEVYNAYTQMADMSTQGLRNRLGELCYARVENDIIVVNMIGQDGTVSLNNPKPVKYWALQKCLETIRMVISETIVSGHILLGKEVKPVIHCPKFGSDLAGGNWDFILEIIREQILEYGIDVVVYEFE